METDKKQQNRYNKTKQVSIVSGITNCALAALKIIFGLLSHSQALIADGLHSLSDLFADGLVLLTAKWSTRAPDHDHPYGHRRIETLSTILIAILLLMIGAGILVDSLVRIHQHNTNTTPSLWVCVIAMISMAVNELLYRYGMHVGKQINSQILTANAWHNRSDAFSSLIVLLSTLGAYIHLTILDLMGAIIIAFFIIHMAIKMIIKATNELIDTAVDPDTLNQINQLITNTKGVLSCHETRTRLHSGFIFIDTHIIVSPRISVSEGHYIGEQVKHKLLQFNPLITDIIFHIDYEEDKETEQLNLPSRDEIISLINKHCQNCPGFNEINDYQLHYIEQKVECWIILPSTLSNTDTLQDIQQQYQKQLLKLDIISQVRILLNA